MDERDNVFNNGGSQQEKPEPEVTETVESIAERYSPEETVTAEAEYQPQNTQTAQPQDFEPQNTQTAQPVRPEGEYAYGYVNPQQQYAPPQQAYTPGQQYAQPQYNPMYSQQWQPGYQPPVEPEDKKKKKRGRAVFCIILAAVLVVAAVAIPKALKDKNDVENGGLIEQDTTVNADAPELELNESPENNSFSSGKALSPEGIYEKISASNVAVMVYAKDSLYTEGTGIVMGVDKSGKYTYVITCAHVISDAGIKVVIQLEDGKRYDADIVGFDERTDIGVLRIEAKGLKAAEFGDSDALKVGSTVYALGNPGGSALFGTFTDGKVSAIGRNITSSIGYDMVCIQHNAAISPGNSGGMLVNEYGQVVGINSSKIAATDYEGISFAIPITQAKDIIDKVIAYGYVPGRAKLGITYVANDNSSISSIYSMAVQLKGLPSGALVIYSIDEDSALKGTDAKPGDMIVSVNGKDLDKADVLLEMIEDSSVGDVLTMELFRISTSGGRYSFETLTVKATLIEEKNEPKEEQTTAGVYGNGGDYGGYGSFDFGDFGFGF